MKHDILFCMCYSSCLLIDWKVSYACYTLIKCYCGWDFFLTIHNRTVDDIWLSIMLVIEGKVSSGRLQLHHNVWITLLIVSYSTVQTYDTVWFERKLTSNLSRKNWTSIFFESQNVKWSHFKVLYGSWTSNYTTLQGITFSIHTVHDSSERFTQQFKS